MSRPVESWAKARMSDLGHLHCGQSPASSTVNTEGIGTIYVTGPEQWDGWRFHRPKWTTDPKRLVPEGCIFITVKGAGVGKIFPGVSAAIGRDIYAFEPKPAVSRKYVELALRASVNDVLRHASGDIPGLSKAHILDHEILVPSLIEQGRIVAEIEKQFSRLDEAVASLKRVKANLKRYKAAILKAAVEGRLVPTEADLARREGRNYETGAQLLQRILGTRRCQWQGKGKYKEPTAPETTDLPELPEGWAWASVDQLAAPEPSSITDGPFGSNLKSEHYQATGPRVIRLQNIKDGEFANEYAHITQDHFDRLRKHRIYAGDLVIASLGDNPPRACLIPTHVGPAIVKADCIRFKPHPSVSAKYLNSALNCFPTRQRVKDVLHGIGRPRLSLGEIRAIALPIPPEAEQRRTVAEVDRLLSIAREAEAEVETNLKRAQALRQAILARAFQPAAVPPGPTFQKEN